MQPLRPTSAVSELGGVQLGIPMFRRFQDVVADLASDGGLRDFYIFDVSAHHWNRLLECVRRRLHDDSFQIDGRTEQIPPTFESIYALRSTVSPCLSIPVGRAYVACHFFSDSEIELDFRPEDYCSPESWSELCEFLQGLVDAVGRPGVVTLENHKTEVIEAFEPRRKVEQDTAPYGSPAG